MEESVQQVIMQSIQELDRSSMGSSATSIILGSGPETDPQLQRILGELEAAAEARDQMAQRCHELDMQVCTGMRNCSLSRDFIADLRQEWLACRAILF